MPMHSMNSFILTYAAADNVLDTIDSLHTATSDPDVPAVAHYATHIAESLTHGDFTHLLSGHPLIDAVLSAAHAFLPVIRHVAATVPNAVITWQGVKAAYYEWSRQVEGGVPDRGKVARTNQLLVAGLFTAAIIKAIKG